MNSFLTMRIIFTVLLLSYGQAHGENWRSVGQEQSSGIEHFIDLDSIKQDGEYVTAWSRETLVTPIFRGIFKPYGYERLTQNAFDCKRGRSAILRLVVRGERGSSLDDYTTKPLDIQFSVSVPGSIGAQLVRTLCAQQTERARIAKEVESFAADPAHPYFDELADDIVAMIHAGYGLKDAYERAVWTNPVTRQKEITRLLAEKEKLREKAENYNTEDPPSDAFVKYSWKFMANNAEDKSTMYLGIDSVEAGKGEYEALVFLLSRSDYAKSTKPSAEATSVITRWLINCKTRQLVPGNSAHFDSSGKFLGRVLALDPTAFQITEKTIGATYAETACGVVQAAASPSLRPREPSNADKKTQGGFGTAWLSDSGYLVTAYHVIAGARQLSIRLPDRSVVRAQTVTTDPANDLAVLSAPLPMSSFKGISLAKSPASSGDTVFTVGFPHPDVLGLKPKFTSGEVSSTTGLADDPRALQISTPVQSGNSGGPLVNQSGEVVGVISAKLSAPIVFQQTGDFPQNINYAVKVIYLQGLLVEAPVLTAVPQKIKPGTVKSIVEQVSSAVFLLIAE